MFLMEIENHVVDINGNIRMNKIKTLNKVAKSFKQEYGYPLREHPAYNLVKFVIKTICEDKK